MKAHSVALEDITQRIHMPAILGFQNPGLNVHGQYGFGAKVLKWRVCGPSGLRKAFLKHVEASSCRKCSVSTSCHRSQSINFVEDTLSRRFQIR